MKDNNNNKKATRKMPANSWGTCWNLSLAIFLFIFPSLWPIVVCSVFAWVALVFVNNFTVIWTCVALSLIVISEGKEEEGEVVEFTCFNLQQQPTTTSDCNVVGGRGGKWVLPSMRRRRLRCRCQWQWQIWMKPKLSLAKNWTR